MIIIGLAIRPLVVVTHLLSHALTAIAITNQRTTIYLGSYGDQEKSAKIRIGLLDIWFTVIPVLWQHGVCIPTDKVSMKFDQKLSYILAGPMMPVAISGIILLIAAVVGFNEYLVFVLTILFGVSVLDLFINFIPRDKPSFTDGYSLKLLLTRKKYPTEFFVAIDEFSRHDYIAAAKHFEKAARKMPDRKNIYEFYLKAKELAS